MRLETPELKREHMLFIMFAVLGSVIGYFVNKFMQKELQ